MGARLIYLMGASGSGKDSLLAYARDRLPADAPVAFAHRYITRPHDAGGEHHVALTPPEFALRATRELFAMRWASHGLHYAIGIEIRAWLAGGLDVVVNGSRAYLPDAVRQFPDALLPVLVEVAPDILAGRLARRGRERGVDIAARLARAREFADALDHPRLVRLDNSGALVQAGDRLVRLLAGAGP